MPGPYAHITLLHELMQPDRLKSILSPSSRFLVSLKSYHHYCALGAVSPDYPNLVQGVSPTSQWADAMHCTKACEMVASGIRLVRSSKGTARDKQLAWLLGYCAHLATDVTIHPVVESKVGAYAENQRQHRICEMNQDSYIYRRMNLGEIGQSDIFAMTVAQCSDPADRTRLDEDIATFWEGMLKDVHPGMFSTNPPDCISWHREFAAMVATSMENAVRLFPLAGVISARMGLAYPSYDAIERQYIEEQVIPAGKPFSLHYDDIFDLAVFKVEALWGLVEQAVFAEIQADLPTFSDWNLDNGRDEHGRLVCW